MLHLVRQYRKLFGMLLNSYISNGPSLSINDPVSNNARDFVKESLKDDLILDKKERDILKNKFKLDKQTINKLIKEEEKELYNESQFMGLDKVTGGLYKNIDVKYIKLYQKFLVNAGYDLGNYGPNNDGIDGKAGKATIKAYNDYKNRIIESEKKYNKNDDKNRLLDKADEIINNTNSTEVIEEKSNNSIEGKKEYKIKIESRETNNTNEELDEVDAFNYSRFIKQLGEDLKLRNGINLDYQIKKDISWLDAQTRKDVYEYEDDDGEIKYYILEDKNEFIDRKDFKDKIKDHDIANGLLKKYGYTDERSFSTKFTQGLADLLTLDFENDEIKSLITRLDNLEELDITDINSIKDYLFDFDSDSIISTKMRDNLSEATLDDYITELRTDSLKNLLENLELSTDFEDITKDIAFKERFVQRLDIMLKMGVPFTNLSEKGGYKKFIKQRIEEEKRIEKEIGKDVSYYMLQNKDEIRDSVKEGFKKSGINREVNDEDLNVVKEFTIAFMTGYKKGAGLNIKVADFFDKKVIVNIGFGVDGDGNLAIGPNLSFREELFKILTVSAGATVTGGGFDVTASGATNNKISKDAIGLSIGAGIGASLTGVTYPIYHASLTDVSSSNVEGYNRAMATAEKVYPKFIEKVQAGEEFSNDEIKELMGNGYYISDEEIQIFRKDYSEFQELYQIMIDGLDGDNKKRAEEKLQSAVLASLSNTMYRQVTGFEITGIGAFIIPGVISGAMVLGEYNWIEHKVVKSKLNDKISYQLTNKSLEKFIALDKDLQESKNIQFDGDKLTVNPRFVNMTGNFENVIITENKDGTISYKLKPGYDLNINLKQKYSYDEKENYSSKTYTIDLQTQEVDGNILGVEVENNQLENNISYLDSIITPRTRYNKYIDEIINVKGTLSSRWEGFEKFANRKGQYSVELTKTIKGFKDVLDGFNGKEPTDKEKTYIISSVTQLIKKSKDMHGGDLKAYNNANKLTKMIVDDKYRRSGFNKELGFNTDNYADKYYERLSKSRGKISETSMKGISFDASSTIIGKNKIVKGVDIFYSNLQILTDKNGPILIPIDNKDDQQGFINMIMKLENLNKENKQLLINGINNGTIVLNYYKDPDGFDDRIIPIYKGSITTNAGSAADMIDQTEHSLGLVGVWTFDETKPVKKEEEKTPPPDEPGKEDPKCEGEGCGDTNGKPDPTDNPKPKPDPTGNVSTHIDHDNGTVINDHGGTESATNSTDQQMEIPTQTQGQINPIGI